MKSYNPSLKPIAASRLRLIFSLCMNKEDDRMSGKLEKAYQKELHKALEKCQFIEETLRMCIFSAMEIARLQVSPHFPIRYKSEDIAKLPLGALVSIFSKINNDTALH